MEKKKRQPAVLSILGEDEVEKSHESGAGELEQCIHELVEAVHARNIADAVSAFRAAFSCMESEDHEEGD